MFHGIPEAYLCSAICFHNNIADFFHAGSTGWHDWLVDTDGQIEKIYFTEDYKIMLYWYLWICPCLRSQLELVPQNHPRVV